MKSWLENRITVLYPDVGFDILIPPNEKFGDYSVNLPFVLAKKEKKNPAELGKDIAEKLSVDKEFKEYFNKIEFVPPGFINFYLSEDFLRNVLVEIIEKKEKYGDGKNKKYKINLEFVSANPTGPPTVGNARAASYGDTLGNIFKKAGYEVAKEYYINDVGVQVKKLGESIKLRMENKEVGPELYQGDYVNEIAKEFLKKNISGDEITVKAINEMIGRAKKSLEEMGIKFDDWFHESKLHESGEVEDTLNMLNKKSATFEKDGALWLKYGDKETDVAVVVKSDGAKTYLMNDIAYTRNKFNRGFDKAINIWGTDHHGDVPRLKGGVALLELKGELEILLHQLVSIKRDGESVRMSKRAGNIEKLEDLVAEVGKDATRYFFLAKDLNTHMEFDVNLAKEQSKKNPVYYIQYAHARLNQIMEKGGEIKTSNRELLKEKEEILLLRKMVKFPELIEVISENYQVHHLAQYAYELASDFHNFYEKHRVVQPISAEGNDNKEMEQARLELCSAVKTTLASCLTLMGISAPSKM